MEINLKIGFIGLGNMGAPMATNLAKNGLDVLGYDTNNSIKLPEITMMPSIPTLLNEVDIVFTMSAMHVSPMKLSRLRST